MVLFILLFFTLNKLVFIFYHADKIFTNSWSDILMLFVHALRLDLSATAYIMGIPVLLMFLQSLIGLNLFNYIIRYYFYIIIAYISIITGAELQLYSEWGAKLNYKAIKYLSNPDEVINTAGVKTTVVALFFIVFQASIGILFFNKYIYTHLQKLDKNWIFPFPYLLISAFLVAIGLRGGLQQIPINQSECYYSKSNDLNVAATNSFWNFMNSIYQNMSIDTDKNPYQFYTDDEAQKTLKGMFEVSKDTSIMILNNTRPNVVLVILESWSADMIKYTQGDSGITPEFEKLCDDGFLFTECYGSGDRSEQGMASIWSAYPAQPEHSIISQPDKFQHLPSIVNSFKQAGYHTSFQFGGQLIYGNIKGYMWYNNFDVIKEGKDFSGYPEGKLGIPDEYIFAELNKQNFQSKQPFFNSIFTLSSHSPYDQPMKEVIKKGGDEKPYLNSVHYTDKSIGKFVADAKKQPWFNNTLFIFVSDHAHPTHLHTDPFCARHHHIPMLFYGQVIKPEYRGVKYTKMIQQHDLAAILLKQLGLKHQEFIWSRNMLNPYHQEFAYMPYSPDGFIYMRPGNEYSIDLFRGGEYHHNYITDTTMTPQLLKEGKSYLQEVFRQYLEH
jgi:phosphoglycerol transferase MdoB-like AlkP superfamily enzyme